MPLRLLLTALASTLLASAALAQSFPARTITFVVPFAPAGPVDYAGRAFAEAMRRQLGQNIVIDNRPGSGGMLGARLVASAKPDGYTLLIGTAGTLVISPLAGWSGPDIDTQLTPVGLIATSPQLMVVSPELKITTLAQFIDFAKARQGTLNIGSGGIGTIPHLAAELFKAQAGLDMLHVPYRGVAPGLPDLMSGRTAIMFGDITSVLQFVEAGRLQALAITSPQRSPLAPTIPTTAEVGWPGLNTRNWQALVGPAGLPADVVGRYSDAMRAATEDQAYIAALAKQGSAFLPSSPERLIQHIAEERKTLGPIVKALNLKLE